MTRQRKEGGFSEPVGFSIQPFLRSSLSLFRGLGLIEELIERYRFSLPFSFFLSVFSVLFAPVSFGLGPKPDLGTTGDFCRRKKVSPLTPLRAL